MDFQESSNTLKNCMKLKIININNKSNNNNNNNKKKTK